ATQAGTRPGLSCTRATYAAAISSLSANGSSKMPMVVIWPRFLARYPSMPSVIDAAMNKAEASNSFSPVMLEKWLLDRIQIKRGMLQMRLSVMELGRFTATDSHAVPGNYFDYPPPRKGNAMRQQHESAVEFETLRPVR